MEFATRFESSLPAPRERFLAHLLEHGLQCGVRTADDFVRHFTPATIMDALSGEPDLRADILEPTVGVRRKVAVRKSAASAAEDLQLALEEGETSPDTVLEHFPADDRVRHLDPVALWTYATESSFWTTKVDDGSPERAHVEHLLRVALDEDLLSPRDVLDGLGVDMLVEHLPKEHVTKILAAVLDAGRSGNMFDDVELLNTLGCELLTRHVPLDAIWTRVLEPKLGERRPAETGKKAAPKAEPKTEPKSEPGVEAAAEPKRESKPDAKTDAKTPALKEPGTPPLAEFDDSSELFDPEAMLRELSPEESEKIETKKDAEDPPKKKKAKSSLSEPTVPKRSGGLPPPKKAKKGSVPPPLPS